jgi:recombinational DNA repair ATPase RecF
MAVLSERVNQYLADMGNSIRVTISSFSEKTSSKGAADVAGTLKSDVKVEVTDGVKNIDPRLYSDGEAGALASALIRALHDLAMQFGQGCNLKLLDEVFSFIDHDNSQLMAASFSNGIGTTVVTDNSGRASGLMDFDTVWVARKRNGKTTLEVNSG